MPCSVVVRVEQLPFCLRIRWLELQVIFVSLIMSDCVFMQPVFDTVFSSEKQRIQQRQRQKRVSYESQKPKKAERDISYLNASFSESCLSSNKSLASPLGEGVGALLTRCVRAAGVPKHH